MNITINTDEPLSVLDVNILKLLLEDEDTVLTPAPAPAAKPKPAKAKVEAPEPMAEPDEEPEVEDEPDEEPEVEDDVLGDDDASDEDLLAMAVKRATDMVANGEAAKVREALDAAGASRVRELNTDNVRDFFKALA